jgi:hypothetical protein
MGERRRQLAERLAAAVERADKHSQRWHRRQRNERDYYRHGYWPLERWRGGV